MSDVRLYVVAQLVVTLALLGFAYATRAVSPGVADVVVGATVAHWLRETGAIGRELAGRRITPAKATGGR